MNFRRYLTGALLGASVLPAFAGSGVTLYDRLGGMRQITEIVNATIDRTSSDPRTRRSFDGISMTPVKESVAQHLCDITGGPCRYEGAPMAKAHTGLSITAEEFDIMDAYLGEELTAHGVSDDDKAELRSLLGPMKPDVVGK